MILHTVVFTGELKIPVGGVTAVGPPPEAAPKQDQPAPANVHDIYNKLSQLLHMYILLLSCVIVGPKIFIR